MRKTDINLSNYENMVASRMMISLAYFCEDIPEQQKYCQAAMTELHPEVEQLIRETEIAGIILFASNFESIEQGVELTHRIQGSRPMVDLPLLIAIDQEGGRVARLPRHLATSFTGNMAIGATYENYGVHFASQVGAVVGAELNAMGVNVNFAPTLDVNSNPDNPVINVRSFGEQPEIVAELGVAKVKAMQQHGVAVALKHFPGHGDTEVDSHTGLPLIDRSYEELLSSDLVPFQKVITEADPAMVMTAHIQYPQIDSKSYMGLDGEPVITPATMSRIILTDILRDQLQFQGVVVTDALGMAGISDYFDPVQAVVETFRAGADLALMPYQIDRVAHVSEFKQFIRDVASELQRTGYPLQQMELSNARITKARKALQQPELSLEDAKARALSVVGNQTHKQLEWQLANRAMTLIHNRDVLPWKDDTVEKIQLVVEDEIQAELLQNALVKYWPLTNDKPLQIELIYWRDINCDTVPPQDSETIRLVIIDFGYTSKVLDPHESIQQLTKAQKKQKLLELLGTEKAQGKTVLVAMQSPYDLIDFLAISDAAIAAYHSVISMNPDRSTHEGVTYEALAAMLTGVSTYKGTLPVSLKHRHNLQKQD